MMAGKTEWEGTNVMLHPHDTIASKADSDVQRGKCHVAAAALLLSCIHDSKKDVLADFPPPLYTGE